MGKFTYSLLSQDQSVLVEGKNEAAFFSDLHTTLQNLIELEITGKTKTTYDIVQKGVSSLRGTLSPYLSTPLRSDNTDIEKGIRDIIDHVIEQTSDFSIVPFSGIVTYRIVEASQVPLHRQVVGVIRRLLKNGKSMLVEGGVVLGKSVGPAYFTQIHTDSIASLPAIYSGVRRLSQSKTEHQYSFINDFVSTVVDAHNNNEKDGGHRIMLCFELNELNLASLRNRFSVLKNQFGIKDILLSQRTLFSGFASQMQLYFTADLNVHPLGSIILSIVGDDSELEDAITTEGSLVVFEKIT